jgi:hypothetical protein
MQTQLLSTRCAFDSSGLIPHYDSMSASGGGGEGQGSESAAATRPIDSTEGKRAVHPSGGLIGRIIRAIFRQRPPIDETDENTYPLF